MTPITRAKTREILGRANTFRAVLCHAKTGVLFDSRALSCLSRRPQSGRIRKKWLHDTFDIKSHKTKDLFTSLKNFKFNSALFIHCDDEKIINFKKASSNIPRLSLLSDKGLNVKNLISFEKIFIEKNSIEYISKRLL